MFECPLCDAEIERDISSQCPECGTVFCVNCHITVAENECYKRCHNDQCRYYGKMLCEGCLETREHDGLRGAIYGALAGLVIGGSYVFVNPQPITIAKVGITLAIVVLGGGCGYLFHTVSELCPRCRVSIHKFG